VCTLAVFFQCSEELPLLVAANRDEFLSRPTSGPQYLAAPRRFVAGIDLVAGGTWLGANEYGLTAAVLNRRSEKPPDPEKTSRGALVTSVLGKRAGREAAGAIQELPATQFNLCSVFVADRQEAFLLANEASGWRVRFLTPGLHVVTNRESENLECPRHERVVRLMEPAVSLLHHGRFEDALEVIKCALRDHGDSNGTATDPLAVPCVHLGNYGTRSATVLMTFVGDRTRLEILHAAGPPCRTPFVPLEALLLVEPR